MTTTTDVFHTTRATNLSEQERQDRAIKAVNAFRKMQPTLSAFARALTRRPEVKVQMDTGTPRTDGKTIYFRPPIELGMDFRHDRSLCEKRGPDLILLCAACAARESVMTTIYHEIAHIAFDSFTPPSEEQRKEIINHAIKVADPKFAESITARITAARYWEKESYLGLASLVSQYLPVMVNALEDARVNREMFRSRPGTKVMFEAWATDAFTNGVEQGDREVVQWKDYPLNAQATVGLFAKAAGYDYSRWFQPVVVAALNDTHLTSLVNQMDNIRSTSGVYELAFPILQRLKQLGFCKEDTDPQDEPEENDAQEQDSQEADPSQDEGGDDDSGPADGDSDADSEGDHEDGSADSNGPPSDSGSGDGDGGEPSESEPAVDTEADNEPDTDDGAGDDTESEELGDEQSASGPDGGDDREESGSEPDGDEGCDADGDQPDGDGSSGTEESDTSDSEGDEDAEQGTGTGEAGDSSASDAGLSAGSGADTEADVPEAEGDAEGSVGDAAGDTGEPTEDGTRDDGTRTDDATEGADAPEEGEDGTEIDTGADKGMGGVEVDGEAEPLPEPGDASDAKKALKVFGDHDEKPVTVAEVRDEQAIDTAIIQGLYFETPSRNVRGVVIRRVDDYDKGEGWSHSRLGAFGINEFDAGAAGDIDVPESVLGPCLLRMRVAFADNARAAQAHNLRSGRVRGRVLGRRAWADDDRLFQKKTMPGKKDYFVVIGIDISGSTTGRNIKLAKRAAMAQAEMLHRAGIKFAVYAHSTVREYGVDGTSLEMYEIKGGEEVWSDKQKDALRNLGPVSENLDGHTLEFYRKRMDESTATHKICLYYTDGKMPAANHDEELEVLRREITTCKRAGYTLLGVGIRTDSPIRHGLDTVQVDDDDDLVKVVRHLEKRMT